MIRQCPIPNATAQGRADARAMVDYSALLETANLLDCQKFTYWRAFVLRNAIAARAGSINVPSQWREHIRKLWNARRHHTTHIHACYLAVYENARNAR